MSERVSGSYTNNIYKLDIFVSSNIPECCKASTVIATDSAFWGFAFRCPRCDNPDIEHMLLEITSFDNLVDKNIVCMHDKNHMITEGLCGGCKNKWTEIYYAGECRCGWPYDRKYYGSHIYVH